MSSFSTYFQNKLADYFRGQPMPTLPATLYVELYTTAPGKDGAGTVVTGGSYARAPIAASLAGFSGTQGAGTTAASTGTSGVIGNNAKLQFPTPTAAWGVLKGWAIKDAATGGNQLMQGTLPDQNVVANGEGVFPDVSVPVNDLTLTFL